MTGTKTDLDSLQDFDDAARRILVDDTDLFDQRHERLRAAVHHRDLAAVEFDIKVIDATPGKGGHQMFDGAHRDAGIICQQRAQTRVANTIPACRDHSVGGSHIGTNKANARICSSGLEKHFNLGTGMQADTITFDRIFQRALTDFGAVQNNVLRVCMLIEHKSYYPCWSYCLRWFTGSNIFSGVFLCMGVASGPPPLKSTFVSKCYV